MSADSIPILALQVALRLQEFEQYVDSVSSGRAASADEKAPLVVSPEEQKGEDASSRRTFSSLP